MTDLLKLILGVLASLFRSRAKLEAENLVLRQQINVLRRQMPKPAVGRVGEGGEFPDLRENTGNFGDPPPRKSQGKRNHGHRRRASPTKINKIGT